MKMKAISFAFVAAMFGWTLPQAVRADVTVNLTLTENPSASAYDSYFAKKLSDESNGRLWALIVVNQDDGTDEGSLTVEWTAPTPTEAQAKTGQVCNDGTQELQYSGRVWHTDAYRTVRHGKFDCTGVWKVRVLDEDGNELASSTYEVK